MSHLREIVLRFDTHDAVVTLDKIISVEVERDIIGNVLDKLLTLGPHIVTIVVEAENMTSYARPVIKALTAGPPALPERPRRLLRRRNL